MNQSNIICRRSRIGSVSLRAAAYSIIGQREYQQDSAALLHDEKGLLAAVCDGMGGLSGGDRASRIAIRTLAGDYMNRHSIDDPPGFLRQEAGKMDREVTGLKTREGKPLEAGSTLVAVFIREGILSWISVGDSRIYLLRDGIMIPLTKDHNYRRDLEDMLQRGVITREQFEKESRTRRADALTSFLGVGGLRHIERNTEPFFLEEGDCLLLCSDGVYKSLNERQICAMLEDNRISAEVSVRRLVDMALTQSVKRQDNTTAVVIHYDRPKEEKE